MHLSYFDIVHYNSKYKYYNEDSIKRNEFLNNMNKWLIEHNSFSDNTNGHIIIQLYNTILHNLSKQKVNVVNVDKLYEDLVYCIYSKNLEHTH
jgi:hypothetical protein